MLPRILLSLVSHSKEISDSLSHLQIHFHPHGPSALNQEHIVWKTLLWMIPFPNLTWFYNTGPERDEKWDPKTSLHAF